MMDWIVSMRQRVALQLTEPGRKAYAQIIWNWPRTGKEYCGLGTASSGLLRFDPETGQFTMYQHDMDRPGTLSNNRVNSVHFDRSGTMWIGTQEGLNRFDVITAASLLTRSGKASRATSWAAFWKMAMAICG